MASGASTEPPPLPPPDYTPISNEEWANKRMPPLKGVIVDPEYPPTAEEALQAIRNHDRNYEAQWQGQQAPSDLKPSSSSSSATSPTSQTSINTFASTNLAPTNVKRSSGSSKIFGRVAGDPNAPSDTTSPSSSTSTSASSSSSSAPIIPADLLTKNPKDLTIQDGFTTLSKSDFANILQQPCFRDTFMVSLVSGFLVAGALWTIGKRRPTIINGGLGVGFVSYMGVYPYCMRQRRLEKQSVKLVKETWEETRAEKRAAWEAYKAKQKENVEHGAKGVGGVPSRMNKSSSVWGWFWSGDGSTRPRGREG